MNKNIKKYGYDEFYEKQFKVLSEGNDDLLCARVTEVQRDSFKIITKFGEKDAKLKGSLFLNKEIQSVYPTVGDFVLVKQNPNGEDIIYKVFERKSKFSRMDSFNKIEQIVACNFDYVCIMSSLNKDFNLSRIERYLSIAWQSNATPIIILTKSDLCRDAYEKKLSVENIAMGVKVIVLSSVTGEGIDELKSIVKETDTVVFLGSSGVGKSSLVNAMAGEDVMKVNDIREADSKGRHTTTHRQLLMLKDGRMIIDTPGMRELQMWIVNEGLDTTFGEIEELAKKCKFRDCSHGSEPGCAVKEALESGLISQKRWKNYMNLRRETRFAEKKEKIMKRDLDKIVKNNKKSIKKSKKMY